MSNHEVVVQKWEESERGWITRPDGFSLHLTDEDREAFIHAYWARMPDEVPDEYSRPSGKPYKAEVGEEILKKIQESDHGIIFDNSHPLPGSGGPDGWRNVKR